jgi:hypothetical protein
MAAAPLFHFLVGFSIMFLVYLIIIIKNDKFYPHSAFAIIAGGLWAMFPDLFNQPSRWMNDIYFFHNTINIFFKNGQFVSFAIILLLLNVLIALYLIYITKGSITQFYKDTIAHALKGKNKIVSVPAFSLAVMLFLLLAYETIKMVT